MELKKIVTRILVLLSFFHLSLTFNLSPKPNVQLEEQLEEPVKKNKERASYFGFSIVLRKKSIFIGAPRAQSIFRKQAKINETGAIFKCNIATKSHDCKQFAVEKKGYVEIQRDVWSHREYQWLGGSMDGGSKESDPLIVCAPRYFEVDNSTVDTVAPIFFGNWAGICYRSRNGNMSQIGEVFKAKTTDRAFLGFSAHLTRDNKHFLIGGPFYVLTGLVLQYDIDKDTEEKIVDYDVENAYFGYAIASGYLSHQQPGNIFYVISAPLGSLRNGQVYVFSNQQCGLECKANFKIEGPQMGNYFGYALLVTDVNGDQVDDLIVTAPLHTVNRVTEVGAIFVYISQTNDNKNVVSFKEPVIITAPFTTKARFGTTITSLGDINRDGYNDVAVGAPLYNGSGAVAIYLGSQIGLQTKPSQILHSPKNSKGFFGLGLSKGVDIDDNGFNDLAIAAPNEDVVYIYRAYPVVNLIAKFEADPPTIKVEAEKVKFRFCYKLDKNSNDTMIRVLSLQLTADPTLKRLKFENDGKLEVEATIAESCDLIEANVTNIISEIYNPIEAQLDVNLKFNGSEQAENFCVNCATMNLKSQRYFKSTVIYDPGCKSKSCNVNLSIKLSKPTMPPITIGETGNLNVGFDINNDGEKAYNTRVFITTSMNLSLASEEADCTQTADSTVMCDIAKRLNFLEGSEHLDLNFNVENVIEASQLSIHAYATSMGTNKNKSDKATGTVQFKSRSSFDIVSYPSPNSIAVGKGDESIVVNFTCILKNRGPSIAKNIDVIINVPSTYKNAEQKILQLTNSTQVVYKSGMLDKLNDAEFDASIVSGNSADIFEQLSKVDIAENRTKLLTCQNATDATATQCLTKTLNFEFIKTNYEAKFEFFIRFNTDSLYELLKNTGNILAFDLNIGLRYANPNNESSLNSTSLSTPLTIEYRPEPLLFWYYVIGAIVGILIVALAVYGLYKFGFFKRVTKEEMQKKLLEKEKMDQEQLQTEVNEDG